MITKKSKDVARVKRHVRLRATLAGTTERPRLAVYRSNKHIVAQIIDDEKQITLVAASSKENGNRIAEGGNIKGAALVGELIAKRALEAGITQVVFDRGGYLYHGRVQALADAAREAGLKF